MNKYTRLDNLYRKYLKKIRGDKCEICGKPQSQLSFPLSVFHILSKQSYPRLRFCDDNILVACWTSGQSWCCHNIFHGNGFGEAFDRRREEIKKRICELRGVNNWLELTAKLLQIELNCDRLTKMKLEALYYYYKNLLKK